MPTLTSLGAADLRQALLRFRDAVRAHQEELNRLNVYPVPDGDTGTNMALTLESVGAALKDSESMAEVCQAISRGSLMGARGNSGVILSQILRGLADECKELGQVEEIWWQSSFDKRRVEGWIVKPPGFDASKKYPLILEIHGGPFANYGLRFTSEIQLYAAAGNVVLYTNPRGSTGYGEEFGNLIHHDYPNHDYEDLISAVDAVIKRGYIDPKRLYVTGGSGGGVLTAWIVGHTDRFAAAVVAKPVINWYSWVLTADLPSFGTQYWFAGMPWDNQENYMKRSPVTYVGNVKTPTMVMTGEVDYRTPSSDAEQFYEALKLRKVPSVMVRVPDASHDISDKPSNMMAKIAYILGWFERYGASKATAN